MSKFNIMFLGRVISKGKKLPLVDFVEITPNKEIDRSIPTLIIGKSIAEEIYGKERIKVLDKKIEDNVFWTYSKTERRNDFEDGLKAFNEMIVKKIASLVRYEHFNLLFEEHDYDVAFVEWLYGSNKKFVFIVDSHLYIYQPGDDQVIGFSLEDAEYMGYDKQSIVDKIKSNDNIILINNDSFLSQQTKLLFGNSNILVPYLYYLSQK